MKLPHNAHMTTLTLDEAVQAALDNRTSEVDLAASKHFWDFEGDWEEITGAYDAYFAETLKSLKQLLGNPIYQGRWDDPGREEWEPVLPEYADAQDLAVWEKEGVRLYFRYSWEDKEVPILMALGAEGCEETGVAYPCQFD